MIENGAPESSLPKVTIIFYSYSRSYKGTKMLYRKGRQRARAAPESTVSSAHCLIMREVGWRKPLV